MVVIGLDLERQLAKGERVTRVCLDTVLEQVATYYGYTYYGCTYYLTSSTHSSWFIVLLPGMSGLPVVGWLDLDEDGR